MGFFVVYVLLIVREPVNYKKKLNIGNGRVEGLLYQGSCVKDRGITVVNLRLNKAEMND